MYVTEYFQDQNTDTWTDEMLVSFKEPDVVWIINKS